MWRFCSHCAYCRLLRPAQAGWGQMCHAALRKTHCTLTGLLAVHACKHALPAIFGGPAAAGVARGIAMVAGVLESAIAKGRCVVGRQRGQGISVTAHERAQGAMLHGVGKWELVIGTHVVRMPEAASVGACEQSTRVPPAGCSSMLWLPLRLHCWRTGRVVYAMLSAAACLQQQHHTHPCHTCPQHLRPARR